VTLTLRTRLTLVCSTAFAALLILVGIGGWRLFARQLDADATERLEQLTAGLHGYLFFPQGVPAIVFDRRDADQAAFVDEATRYYQIYDARSGRLLVQSPGLEPLGVSFTSAEVRRFLADLQPVTIETAYGRFRIASSVVSARDGGRYLLQVAVSLESMDQALRRYVDLWRWRVLPALLAALAGIWWVARAALMPLSRLAAETKRVGIGTLDRRVTVRGAGDQLDEVAEAFNQTLGRLERSVGEMRQFSSALAHELRTPLTALRGEIELALGRAPADSDLQRSLASQIEEIDTLSRLISQLLTLARAESGEIPLKHERVDLGALAAVIVDELDPVAAAHHIDLGCAVSDAASVCGDRDWLERLLINLLDNALKFTRADGRVVLSVAREGALARITVRDTGIGIAPAALPHIFDRFYRADASRSSRVEGAGLGLSLVRWIVERHQGRVEVESRVGEGSTFTVWLPTTASINGNSSRPHVALTAPRQDHASERSLEP
jgi:heavy metal sensor kinase